MSEVGRIYAIGIIVSSSWSGIKMARDVVEGGATKQYTLLSAELKRGNTCKINVDRISPILKHRFGSLYFFLEVDGCHLKTKNDGCLFVGVERDPNDQYYPLAFGVVETEIKES